MTSKTQMDELYHRYNRLAFVHPDPLEFLYRYPDLRDREIVAIIASALAYGRVAQILSSVARVLSKLGPSPFLFLMRTDDSRLRTIFGDFRHRFAKCRELCELMGGVRNAIERHGSLNNCFALGLRANDKTVVPALDRFVAELGGGGNHLLPDPRKGSACKRLNLFLRWMVRKDAVDPGGWCGIQKSCLVVPLDTHMAAIGRELGFTVRKTADMQMALEITNRFKKMVPADPVKYDFALTRFGIRSDLNLAQLTGALLASRF